MNEARAVRRGNRDPEGTRREILQAALEILSRDGPEGLNVTEVARRAGINRGTAYQHFPTREALLHATAEWVAERMVETFYGQADPLLEGDPLTLPERAQERLSRFAMENPELARAWLFDLLTTKGQVKDPFWTRFVEELREFARAGYSRPGLDVEVYAFISLVSSFLWPAWVEAHADDEEERRALHRRFVAESMRIALFGTLAPEPNRTLREKYAPAGEAPAEEKAVTKEGGGG